MTSEHGHCPHCAADLDGGSIWQTFMDQYGDEAKADEVAENYGATRTQGRWGRCIALYDRDKDRTVGYRCPDCDGEWER